MRQEEFEDRYVNHWKKFEVQINLAEALKLNKKKGEHSLKGFADNYRQLCYCLALARERHYSPLLIHRLEALVFRGHQSFYQKRLGIFQNIFHFILHGFPQAVRQQANFIWASSALFYLPLIVVFLLMLVFPDMIYMIVDPGTVTSMENMYDPAAERFGTERSSDSDFYMFGHYIRNNIGIAFQIFAGGILLTIGSQFYLLFNGFVFGAIAGHIYNIGYSETFFSFVIGHGAFELTGIVVAGGAGLQLGWAILSPGVYSRKQALVNAAKSSIQLVYGSIFLLLIAAFVEAFWSSTHMVSANTKYWVGGIFWILVIGYLTLLGRRKRLGLTKGSAHGS
ncbi:MAG: stage II sporulation protein M [Deltaproteobacteria bacterium]|nr:stage II sporulation protein M [Deltaproteobacteria bacterium]